MKKKKTHKLRLVLPLILVIFILGGVYALSSHIINDSDNLLPNTEPLLIKGSSNVIVIDAGHGGPDSPGCMHGDVTESDITLKIAKSIDAILQENGYKTRMIRTEDVAVGTVERAQMAKPGDIYVSVHINAQEGGTEVSGIETWYNKDIKGSFSLASKVQAAMLKETGAKDREVKESAELIVTRESKVPSCLAEVGFLSNPEERALLSSEAYQKRLAQAMAKGVMDYLSD